MRAVLIKVLHEKERCRLGHLGLIRRANWGTLVVEMDGSCQDEEFRWSGHHEEVKSPEQSLIDPGCLLLGLELGLATGQQLNSSSRS